MHNRPEPEAMDEYYTDCASLPEPLQPHADPAGALPGPLPGTLPWGPVRVPELARSMVDGLGPFV